MLSRLTIRNLALVDSLTVCFEEGLNVITGETGAGKSLLIGALRLLLGERADRTMIRSGESSCSVEASFQLARPGEINALLNDAGLPPCEEGELILRRQISESASRNLVNDSPVTLPLLKRLGDELVDMHGPYDHQSLLKTSAQLAVLDSFGRTGETLATYRQQWARLQDLERALQALTQLDPSGLQEQIDLLLWRIKEVEEAAVSEEDEQSVEQEHEQIANAQTILELAQCAVNALTEASDSSAFDGLSAARRACLQMEKYVPDAAAWAGELDTAARSAQEISTAIQDAVVDLDAGPERLRFLDERLSLYRNLKRKYAPSIPGILELLGQWKARLHELQTLDTQRADTEADRAAALAAVLKTGEAVRKTRRGAADKLALAITAELRDLGFEHGQFAIDLMPCEPCATGIDAVEFGFAPNAGEAMRPLRAIASSGEISRVMLAVKSVLARHDRIPLMVFDEIDANVGGKTSRAVGAKLAQVGQTHQVIAITHLPQVAVFGSAHFAVVKQVLDGRTFTRIERLQDEQRVEEVARMLGGKESTGVTLRHAQELLAGSKG